MPSAQSQPFGRLFLTAACCVLAACAAPGTPAAPGRPPAPATGAPDPKVLGEWRIEQARSEPLLYRATPRLRFGADGRLTGNGSCNTLSAPYTLVGNALTIGPIETGRMACADALMEQEDRVITALERAVTARVPSHGYLELRDQDGRGLLRAAPASGPAPAAAQ